MFRKHWEPAPASNVPDYQRTRRSTSPNNTILAKFLRSWTLIRADIGIIWRLLHRKRELALATIFWFTICHCFPIMSSHSLSFKWLLRLSALHYIPCIIRTTTVASRKIHILCIKFKIRTLWLLTQLYVMVAFYSRIEITWITALLH